MSDAAGGLAVDDLEIAETSVAIAGRRATAMTFNGTVFVLSVLFAGVLH